jgi:hypothetical protein
MNMALKKKESWFEVDKEGLRQLQESKSKHNIMRELVQNAWDEKATLCEVKTLYLRGTAEISVKDNSPEGFRDIKDAYTFFAKTYKRADPEKRGRFNMGEKQILALCEKAIIETTKGTLIFDSSGRAQKKKRREVGTMVQVFVKMSREEYDEMLRVAKLYLVPKGIAYSINGETIPFREPYKIFEATLPTESEKNGIFRKTERKTMVHVQNPIGIAWLFEMGLPVCEIESKYSFDVQQKVPLSIDRDTVPQSFLEKLFAEALNVLYDDIKSDESSESWIRIGAGSDRIKPETTKAIITKRFGDKVVIATPNQPLSNNDALANGYKVVHGKEFSKKEWENVRKEGGMETSYEKFPHDTVLGEDVVPTPNMLKFKNLAIRIAKDILNIDVEVKFKKWVGVRAQYGDRTFTVNVMALGKDFFKVYPTVEMLDLIIHELGHEKGMHTERSYHQALTLIGATMTLKALEKPEFFKIGAG